MKKITADNLPEQLTDEIIETLANMVNEIPLPKEWHEIYPLLSRSDYRRVMDKRLELQRQKALEEESAKSEAQKAKEKAWWEKYHADKDPHKFYGNMGQPETAQEFKNRYGVWPPNYTPEDGEE